MLRKIAEHWFGVRNKQQAQHAKQRLSLVYAFIGWNSFAVIFYCIMKERMPKDDAERRKTYSTLTGTSSNVHVYQVTGMTVQKEFQLVYDRLDQAKEKKQRTATT